MSELKDTLITGILECSGNTLIKGNLTLQSSTVALGSGTSVGANSVSIGLNAGSSSSESISIGVNSGNTITGGKNIAIGTSSNIINTGSNNIFVGENSMPSTNSSVSNCISIGTNAKTNFSNSVSIGVGATTTSSNQIVLGTTTENIIIPGGISTNSITLLYSSVPTFTSNQIGFTVSNTVNPTSITTATDGNAQTLSTINLSSNGVWLITFNITNGSFSSDTALDAEIYINSTRVSRASGRGITGSTNISVEGTYIYKTNLNTNTIVLKARITGLGNATITSPIGYFQAVRIA
jgi:hypothetical protein